MPFWKKVTSFFFEETDSDIIAEDELEPIEVKKKPVVEKKEEAPYQQEANVETARQATPVKADDALKSKFVSINLHDEAKTTVEKPVVETKSRAQHMQHVSESNIRKEEKKEFEFTPVISPIFGAKDEDGTATSRKAASTSAKSATILRATKKKRNPLGTIISPYYGVNELDEFEAEAQKDIEEKEKIRKEEVSQAIVEQLDQLEEVNSIQLEDMISEDDLAEDDLMQISLFGEAAPVHEIEDSVKEK